MEKQESPIQRKLESEEKKSDEGIKSPQSSKSQPKDAEKPINPPEVVDPSKPLPMTQEARLEKGSEFKEQAKEFVKNKDFLKAIELYEKALMTSHPSYFSQTTEKIFKEVMVLTNNLLNNLCYCYLSTKNYEKALSFANQVLQADPRNMKTHYRKAICYKHLNDLERAFNSIKDARRICVENNENEPSIFQEYDTIKGLYQSYLDAHKEKEKELYSKMMKQSSMKRENSSGGENSSQSKPKPENEENKEQDDLESIVNNSLIVLPSTLLGMVLCHYVFKMKANEGKSWLSLMLMSGSWSGTIISQKRWLKALFALVSVLLPAYFYRKSLN